MFTGAMCIINKYKGALSLRCPRDRRRVRCIGHWPKMENGAVNHDATSPAEMAPLRCLPRSSLTRGAS